MTRTSYSIDAWALSIALFLTILTMVAKIKPVGSSSHKQAVGALENVKYACNPGAKIGSILNPGVNIRKMCLHERRIL